MKYTMKNRSYTKNVDIVYEVYMSYTCTGTVIVS